MRKVTEKRKLRWKLALRGGRKGIGGVKHFQKDRDLVSFSINDKRLLTVKVPENANNDISKLSVLFPSISGIH
jgi:hypothetical protein